MGRWLSILALASALSAPAAQAGPYSDAVRTQQGCGSLGQIAATAFQDRPADIASMTGDQRAAAAGQWLNQSGLADSIHGAQLQQLLLKAVFHAFVDASSTQDAYGYAWGKCMDVYGPQ